MIKDTTKSKIKFITIFVLGIFAFLVPFSLPIPGLEEKTILISHFVNFIEQYCYNPLLILTILVQFIIIITAIIGIYRRITKFDFKFNFINEICQSSIPMILMKLIGSLFFLTLAFTQLGFVFNLPQTNNFNVMINTLYKVVTNPDTGGTTFSLVISLFLTFFIGNLLLPLLTDFGAVEFIGSLASKIMRSVFKVPGYSAIDAIASFVGDGTIGIIVTDHQYQRGYYTQREAGIIATSFSIVGIAFATLVAEKLGFANNFFIFYGTILLVTIIIAFIFARINFFNFSDKYYEHATRHPKDEKLSFHEAFLNGVEVCQHANIKNIMTNTAKQIITTYIIFVPTIMCVGTLGLILATYTDFFSIISLPFVSLLDFFGFGDSSSVMAPSLLVGFVDMYLPTLFVSDPGLSISSAAKFFIGVLSFCQLIFISETGMVFLNTKIGFKFVDLVKLFVIRTIISIPIILLITYGLSAIGIVSF